MHVLELSKRITKVFLRGDLYACIVGRLVNFIFASWALCYYMVKSRVVD